jgi:large repetitive protein
MLAVARCLAVLLAVGAPVAPATALAEVPFAARYSANEPGAIWVTGSTLMTCPAAVANCAASQAGTATGAALNNNSWAMVQVDADSDPATLINSSSSTFTPPAAHDVLFAGLYFGGRVTGGAGGAPAPNAAARGTALFQTPTSGGYVPVSGTVADSTPIAGSYVTFADVTALVRAGGTGRYWVGNVQSGTGLDRYAGWSLIVVYRDPAQPLRNLSVFDGLQAIQQGDPPLAIGVSGFRTPLSGPVRTSVGVVAYEGDRGSSGDRLALNGQLLSDAANPPTNVFNSSVSFQGTNTLSQRIPAYVNALGFDSDRIVADGFLANGATSASFAASTTLDQYLIQAVTFTTDLSAPQLVVDKSVVDLNGGDVEPGDVLRYLVTTRNTGDDAATDLRVGDSVPAQTSLVAGSLSGPAGAAAADGRSVEFTIGTLAPDGTASAAFDVLVDDDAPDGFAITNTATASGLGASAGRPVSATSPEVTSIVQRPPFEATLIVTPSTPTAGEPATATVELTNDLGRPIDDVVETVSVPGADVIRARPTSGGRCTVRAAVRCALGPLAPGEQARIRVRLRPLDRGTLRPVVRVRGEGVATQRIRLGPVRVKAGSARLRIRKSTRANFTQQGRLLRYRIVVTARRRAAAAHRVRVCDRPGRGLRLRSASGGGVLRNGRACWRLGKLLPGRSRRLTAVARVTGTSGVVANTAVARSSNLRGRRKVADVARVQVAPGFPGACAAAAGPHAHAAC